MPVFPSYRNQSIDLQSKSIDWLTLALNRLKEKFPWMCGKSKCWTYFCFGLLGCFWVFLFSLQNHWIVCDFFIVFFVNILWIYFSLSLLLTLNREIFAGDLSVNNANHWLEAFRIKFILLKFNYLTELYVTSLFLYPLKISENFWFLS